MQDESTLRSDLIEAAKEMENKGLLPGTSGNLSLRLSNDLILVTPSGGKKGKLSPSDLVKVDLNGTLVEGAHSPSSEIKMHLTIYRNQINAGAVIHAHPPFATAFAAAGFPLDKGVLPEIIVTLGEVPLVPYGTPSTWDLPNQLIPYLKNHRACLLENHGAVTYGLTITEAYYQMESLEFCAKVTLLARMLGGEKTLSERSLQQLEGMKTTPGILF